MAAMTPHEKTGLQPPANPLHSLYAKTPVQNVVGINLQRNTAQQLRRIKQHITKSTDANCKRLFATSFNGKRP